MKNSYDVDKKIAGLRKEYTFGTLEERDCALLPHRQFVKWFDAAVKVKSLSVNAAALSTCGESRKPSARIVLIKSFGPRGFVFYTSYQSRKALDLLQNRSAEILFYWPELERQVRISGKISKISSAASEAYFASRPRAAQIGAWASQQSQPVKGRDFLEHRYQQFEKKFSGKAVPRPDAWGGFCLLPQTYEFWQGRANRLNDRILYKKSGKTWKRCRLQP